MMTAIISGRGTSRLDTIELDAIVSESHNFSSTATSFPIESGAVISDHIFNNPEEITISGIVSNSPLYTQVDDGRTQDAFNRLVEIFENKELITVVTGLKVYTSMSLANLTVPRDQGTGQALRFNATLRKVNVLGSGDVFEQGLEGLLDAARLKQKIKNTVKSSASELERAALSVGEILRTVKEKIPRAIVGENSDFASLATDPIGSLKDQVQAKANYGRQIVRNIHPRFEDASRDILQKLLKAGEQQIRETVLPSRAIFESYSLPR